MHYLIRILVKAKLIWLLLLSCDKIKSEDSRLIKDQARTDGPGKWMFPGSWEIPH